MSAPTTPSDRLAQERQFVAAIQTLEQGSCTPDNAVKFAQAGETIVEMIRSGMDVNRGFEKEGLEHFTPIGLFNAMAKDLIPAKGVQKLESFPPSVAVPTIESFVKTYKHVISASLDANPTLVMHTMGDDPDAEDLQSTAGLMDLKDAKFVARCLEAGIVFSADTFSHLNRQEMVGHMNEPVVIAHIKNLHESHSLLEELNEVNNLVLLRPEELKEYLAGPGKQFLPQSVLDHAFHCAISNHSKADAIEAWLDAGASVEGSSQSIFGKTALGSAIFASPLGGHEKPDEDDDAVSALSLAQGGIPPGLANVLQKAQAGGTQIIGVAPGADVSITIGAGGAQVKGGTPLDPTAGAAASAEPEERCVVQMLVDRGAMVNPNCGRQSPLAQAYEKGSPVLIDLLESKGAVFTHEDEKKYAFLRCAEHGSNKALEKLLAQNIDINEVVARVTVSAATDKPMTNTHTALTMAAMMGQERTVDMLLGLGANPDVKVNRTVAFASHDEDYQLNFLQEAIRLDQPKVLQVAIARLGIDRVLQENVPKSARNCTELVQAIKAAQVANTSTLPPSPAP